MKQRIFGIVSNKERAGRLGNCFEKLIMTLIAASVIAIILESFDELAIRYSFLFDTFEAVCIVVFTIEYVLRLWTADLLYPDEAHPRLKFICTPMAVVDLLVVLPFYIPFFPLDLRFLRMSRLFRLFLLLPVFKLGRYLTALKTVSRVIWNSRSQLVVSTLLCFFVMLFSAIVMYTVENPAQPDKFPNIVATLWWALCTLTTVGYGDVYPVTSLGKLFAAIISLVGIGVIAIPTGIIASGFTQAAEREEVDEEEPADADRLSEDEQLLLYYHGADEVAREIAMDALRNHQKEENVLLDKNRT